MTTGSVGPSPVSPVTHGSPAHLRGLQPASTGMRATALVVDAVVVSLISTMCLLPTVIAVQLSSTVTIAVAAVFAFLGAVAVIWFEIIDLWRRGQTLGMRVVGLSWLRWSLPGRPGLNAISKLLVLSIVSALTLGIGAVIIYLISEDRSGRSWFDRISDIIVVTDKDTDAVEEPSGRGTGRRSSAHGDEAFSPQWWAPSETRSADASAAASGAEEFITEVPWRSGEPEETAAPARRPTHPESSSIGHDGDPAAAHPVSTPLSPLSTRQEQADSPVASGAAPMESQDHWASVDPCAEEDPMDRTVARTATRSAPSLLLDTGQRVDLGTAGTVLLGRDPQAVAPWEGACTVAVDDPGFSISKTHVAVVLEGTDVFVEDLGSTNGTTVEAPEGALTTAGEGQRVRAGVGDIVHFGRRRFTVGR